MISKPHDDYLILREYLTKHVPASPETDKAQDASERLTQEVAALKAELSLSNGLLMGEKTALLVAARDLASMTRLKDGHGMTIGEHVKTIKLLRDNITGNRLFAIVGFLFGGVGWFL